MQVLVFSQSYLHNCGAMMCQKKVNQHFKTITDKSVIISPILLLIAFAGLGYWVLF
jgi:hypothetical protein